MHKSTDHIKFALAESARLTADLQKLSEPSNHIKSTLAESARFAADLQRLSEPSNHIKSALAESARFAADLQRLSEPSNHIKSALAESARFAADLQRLSEPSNHIKSALAESVHLAANLEKGQEHRNNYVETDYNRDLAYQGIKEPNHAIEDYDEVIISNLELEGSIFGDGSAFSAGNEQIPINITINVRQMNIGQIIQGEKIEMKSEVSNSQVGVLNTGKIQAKSITGSVSPSADPSQQQIAEALTSLTEAVKASQNISSQRQTEIIEQLKLLNEQAKLAPSERKVGLIKPILSALATALSAGGGAAEIWSQWGDAIKIFFGLNE